MHIYMRISVYLFLEALSSEPNNVIPSLPVEAFKRSRAKAGIHLLIKILQSARYLRQNNYFNLAIRINCAKIKYVKGFILRSFLQKNKK
jgi:hypothetical protein